ncbi:hypothetical protein JI664_21495 [Rhodobacter sp. NTK016B]|uniref:hypothetical protein n=1 Tax=Rhodobacter sp. NTK016B TaxID=2759676 RepID=UPI001A8C5ECD|nr:hypothetical protein [Rhodobacter sp. NTK016B]MBN8294562.1 hypothetical protein [Rhodobacter sp. NTK016B]
MQATIKGFRYDTDKAELLVTAPWGEAFYRTARGARYFTEQDGRIKAIEEERAVATVIEVTGRDEALRIFGAEVVQMTTHDDLRATFENAMEDLNRIRNTLQKASEDLEAVTRSVNAALAKD